MKDVKDLPFVFDWVKFKGEDVVARYNFEASKKAKRPMYDIHYCMTKAFNNIVLKTVQYDKKKFKKSELSEFK